MKLIGTGERSMLLEDSYNDGLTSPREKERISNVDWGAGRRVVTALLEICAFLSIDMLIVAGCDKPGYQRSTINLNHTDVREFVPVTTARTTTRVRIGTFSFAIPVQSIIDVEVVSRPHPGLSINMDASYLIAWVPTYDPDGQHLCRLRTRDLPSDLTSDEVSLRAAAYAADKNGYQDRKTKIRGPALEELLAIKGIICASVDYVQVVRLPTVKGLALVDGDQDGGTLSVSFEYLSLDEKWRGTALFGRRGKDSEATVQEIHGVISSFEWHDTGPVESDINSLKNEKRRLDQLIRQEGGSVGS